MLFVFFREMETRQKFENDKRRLVTENKNFQNTIQQLEADVNDLKQALTEEQEARVLQVHSQPHYLSVFTLIFIFVRFTTRKLTLYTEKVRWEESAPRKLNCY